MVVDVTRETFPATKKELIELLAAIEHERWADWQKWLHSKCEKQEDGSLVIPSVLAERWERQIATPYAELSDEEKSSDRLQVYRYWAYIRVFFEQRGADPTLE